ncbi:hypothetical protein, partial [Streptococcus pneumoniae]|uniref:hypothetical protein n=1 Tax=Streptococcus pneumoniae TaxID=1313 RepID=UPI0019545214
AEVRNDAQLARGLEFVPPGDERGSYTVTLQGELGTMLGWIDRSGKPGYKPKAETASSRMSVSVNGGACPGHPRLGPSR